MTIAQIIKHFGLLIGITIFSLILNSCSERKTKTAEESNKEKIDAYLETYRKKEVENKRLGGKHVKSIEFEYELPKGWTKSDDLDEGSYIELFSEDGLTGIRLSSRYIESIPEGVNNPVDWINIQYEQLGIPDALKKVNLISGSNSIQIAEAWVHIDETHLRSRMYTNIFSDDTKRRIWCLVVFSNSKDLLSSEEVEEFLTTFKVNSFDWNFSN